MQYTLKTDKTENLTIPASKMKVGELGEVHGSIWPDYNGMIVLMTGELLVSLSDPKHRWSSQTTLPVLRLPKGTTITLTVTD